MEDIQARLSNQIETLELKLQKFKVIDGPTDQIKKFESKVQWPKVSNQLSDQIKGMETKLHKLIEQHLKSLEKVSKQSNVFTMVTASKVVDEYHDMERRNGT